MLIEETDLFRRSSQECLNELSKIVVDEAYDKGVVLFTCGDPAKFFYMLVEGSVRLAVGKKADLVYTVSVPGESFGWSSLVGSGTYSGRAQCAEQTRLFKISGERLDRILMKHPLSAMEFFKSLAGAMGARLLAMCDAFPYRQAGRRKMSQESAAMTRASRP